MRDGETLTVQGENGSVFEMDVPTSGTVKREVFDGMLAKGTIRVLDGGTSELESEPERPDEIAGVGAWRKYAVAMGMDADEAKKTGKPALIAAYPAPDSGDDEALADLATWAEDAVEDGEYPDTDAAFEALANLNEG